MLLAKASALYMPTENLGEYRMVKWYNRPDLDLLTTNESNRILRNKDTRNSPVADTLTRADEPFAAGHIPALCRKDRLWPQNAIGRAGLKKDFDWVVVIPVRELGATKLLCGVALYYRKNSWIGRELPLSGAWKETVRFISYQMALLIMAIQRRQQLGAELREYLTHELKQRVDGVEQRVDEILEVIKASCPKTVWQGLEVKRRDLAAYRREFLRLMGSYDRVDFDQLADGGPSLVFRLLTGHDDKGLPQAPEQIELRSFLNEIAHSELARRKEKKLEWNNFFSREVSLHVNKNALRHIFQNLLNNAAKYSVPKSAIGAGFVVGSLEGKSVAIGISNYAPCLQPDEEYSIFLEGYRGSNVGASMSGRGRGLFLVTFFAQRLGGEVDLEIEDYGKEVCRFHFMVVLPRKLFIEDGSKKCEDEI